MPAFHPLSARLQCVQATLFVISPFHAAAAHPLPPPPHPSAGKLIRTRISFILPSSTEGMTFGARSAIVFWSLLCTPDSPLLVRAVCSFPSAFSCIYYYSFEFPFRCVWPPGECVGALFIQTFIRWLEPARSLPHVRVETSREWPRCGSVHSDASASCVSLTCCNP